MKTTIEIADGLLKEAKRVAAQEKTTVRALVEDGLRRALADRKKKGRFTLRLVTAGGDGLNPNVPADLPRRLAYDEDPETAK